MPEQTIDDMRAACHALAEHILRRPCKSNRSKWLRDQLVDQLTKNDHILYYADQYDQEYPYSEIRNPYLVEVLKNYDGGGN